MYKTTCDSIYQGNMMEVSLMNEINWDMQITLITVIHTDIGKLIRNKYVLMFDERKKGYKYFRNVYVKRFWREMFVFSVHIYNCS